MSKFNMDFSKLLSQLETVNTKKTGGDENEKRFWKLTKDKDGNGSAIIRFLPNKDIEEIPFVRIYSHAFQNKANNRWYIELSSSTIGETDYIAEVNRELWESGVDANKKIASYQKRKMQYIANILVVKDPANPENDGKVFLFKFGKTIFDKINAAANPEKVTDEDGEDQTPEPVNAFSPIEGAAFNLKQTIVDGWPNFDGSSFLKKKALFNGDDDEIEKLFEGLYELREEIAPAKFKSYEDGKKRYLWVMGLSDGASNGKAKKPAAPAESDDSMDDDEPAPKPAAKPAKAAAKPARAEPPMPKAAEGGDDDDEFFRSLAND